jgi:peptidoglycan/xylan/chitin deacetylase (PgdA/CDA1 family)
VVLRQNGTVATRGYELNNITRRSQGTFKRPLLSITFDDGWESAFTNGASLLNSRGLPGTFYINPSTLDTSNFMTAAQVKNLQKRGNQIASHGYEHLDMTTLSAHRLERELSTAQTSLARQFNIPNPQDYASPYGRSDPQVQYYVRQHYRSQRSTDNGINTKQNFEPYNLLVFYMGSDTKLGALQQALTQTKEQHGWLILVYHRVEGAHPHDATIMEPAAFSQQLDCVQASKIPVVTVDRAMQELQNQR